MTIEYMTTDGNIPDYLAKFFVQAMLHTHYMEDGITGAHMFTAIQDTDIDRVIENSWTLFEECLKNFWTIEELGVITDECHEWMVRCENNWEFFIFNEASDVEIRFAALSILYLSEMMEGMATVAMFTS
jgi:hypothetical protein